MIGNIKWLLTPHSDCWCCVTCATVFCFQFTQLNTIKFGVNRKAAELVIKSMTSFQCRRNVRTMNSTIIVELNITCYVRRTSKSARSESERKSTQCKNVFHNYCLYLFTLCDSFRGHLFPFIANFGMCLLGVRNIVSINLRWKIKHFKKWSCSNRSSTTLIKTWKIQALIVFL